MRSLKALLASTLFIGGAVVVAAGEDASDEGPETLDSLGSMFLEVTKSNSTPVSEEISPARYHGGECNAKDPDITARMANLRSLLELTDETLTSVQLPEQVVEGTYETALKAVELELWAMAERRETMKNAIARYRKAIQATELEDAISAAVIADVEAALAEAEAALEGEQE